MMVREREEVSCKSDTRINIVSKNVNSKSDRSRNQYDYTCTHREKEKGASKININNVAHTGCIKKPRREKATLCPLPNLLPATDLKLHSC
jgi:hypothetical protein